MKINIEKQICEILKEDNFKKYDNDKKKLLQDIYEYIREPGENDFYAWEKSNYSNFMKVIKGERSFSKDLLLALERTLKMSLWDIYSYSEKTQPNENQNKEFEPKGIRYVAYYDDINKMKDLSIEVDEFGSLALYNTDEFEKSFVDYVIEYKSKKCFKYLVKDKQIFYHRYSEVNSEVTESKVKNCWEILCDIDDADLFKTFLGVKNDYGYMQYSFDGLSPEMSKYITEQLWKTKNIKEYLLTPEKLDCGSQLNEFLIPVLITFMKNGMNTQANEILDEYSKILNSNIEEGKKSICVDNEKNLKYRLRTEKYGCFCTVKYSEKTIMYYWDFEEIFKGYGVKCDRISEFGNEYIISKITQTGGEKLAPGESRTDVINGVIYKNCGDSTEIEMLKIMKKNGVKCVPEYLGEEDGVHKIGYIPSRYCIYPNISDVLSVLSEVHSVSPTNGESGVYLFNSNFKGELFKIEDRLILQGWEKCKIGDPFTDVFNAIFQLCNFELNNSSDRTRDEILSALDKYKLEEVKKNLADKFILEADKMIEGIDDSCNNDYRKRLYNMKNFMMYYKNKFD